MGVIKTDIEGVVIIEPKVFKDARGYYFESFSQREFDEKVRLITFIQDNKCMSSYGVIRGLHFQHPPFNQIKLVRCVGGVVQDITKIKSLFGVIIPIGRTALDVVCNL